MGRRIYRALERERERAGRRGQYECQNEQERYTMPRGKDVNINIQDRPSGKLVLHQSFKPLMIYALSMKHTFMVYRRPMKAKISLCNQYVSPFRFGRRIALKQFLE